MNKANITYRPGTGRIESIDVIRGLTILVMIFVNDIAGVPGTPAWMRHMPGNSNGMTFVDLVFPAFLFIVGMSVPFSIGRRIEKDNNLWPTWKHIIVRVFGLLILGFYMVNGDQISDQGIINPHVWIIIMYLCVIVIWNKNNKTGSSLSQKSLKYIATAVLIILAFLYTNEDQTGFIQMRPYWWGILGLIGWAYLSACLIYIPLRKSQTGLLGGVVLLYCFYMAVEAGMLSNFTYLESFMNISYTFGSHTAIILSGIMLGNKLLENAENPDHKIILKWSFGFGLSLFLAGLFLNQLSEIHTMFFISKNLGTVPWCLISSALTIWIWMFSYWFIDIQNFKSWTKIIEPAGTNPLFAYILAPLAVECFILTSYLFNGFNFYSWLGETFYIGFIRSLALAFSMTWLTGFLYKKGIRLKL